MTSPGISPEEASEFIDKQLKGGIGEKYVKEADQFSEKMDDVNAMLKDLISKDKEKSQEASQSIEDFIKKQAKEDSDREEREKFVMGCKTVTNRTSINTKEVTEEKRRKNSEDIKMMGNEAFRSGDFKQAEEYYTSALLQWDKNYLLFTNRAQARIKLKKYQDAVDDCKEAIKLKQDCLKTIIISTKALRGMKNFQKALDVLEVAENFPNVNTKIIETNRRQIIDEMKEHMKK